MHHIRLSFCISKMFQGTTASIFEMKERFGVLVCCRSDKEVKSHHVYIFNYYFDYVLKVAACEFTSNFRMAGVSNSNLMSYISEQKRK